MKKSIIFIILFIYSCRVMGGAIFVDVGNDGFTVNFQKLVSQDKTCFLVNCIKSDFVAHKQNFTLKPLIVLKVFDWKVVNAKVKFPEKLFSLSDYCNKSVIPALIEDMKVSLINLRPFDEVTPANTFDSLIVHKDGKFEIYTGFIIAEFFNLVNFPQVSLLQTNRTVFNTGATIVSVYSWVGDSLPVPAVDEMLDRKMFLLKKNGNDFTFFCHPSSCSDCPLNFYNEYVYRKDYGIIAFKSKYVIREKFNANMAAEINESDEYYYFR